MMKVLCLGAGEGAPGMDVGVALRQRGHVVEVLELIESSARVEPANVRALGAAIDAFSPDIALLWEVHGRGDVGLVATLGQRALPWLWRVAGAPSWIEPFLQGGSFLVCSQRHRLELERRLPAAIGLVHTIPPWSLSPDDGPVPSYRPGSPLRITLAHDDHGVVAKAVLSCNRGEGLPIELVEQNQSPHLCVSLRDFTPGESRDCDAVLDAAAAGSVPLIGETGDLAEWLVHDVHCLKVAPSADQVAQTLDRVRSGAVALDPLARRTRSLAIGEFGLGRAVERVEAKLTDTRARHGIADHARVRRISPDATEKAYRAALLAARLIEHTHPTTVQEESADAPR